MIELLIVVAIILIIAAIAIPNLLRARIAANESSAAASVRSIATAEVTYNAAYPSVGYAARVGQPGRPARGMHSEFSHGVPHRQRAYDRGEERVRVQGYGFSFRRRRSMSRLWWVPPRQRLTRRVSATSALLRMAVLRSNPGVAGGLPAPDVATCVAYAVAQ